jgi:hypothetical protein
MNALQLLCRMTERQIDTLFRNARALPADRLDWKPSPDSRSALDQLQEVATSCDTFREALKVRKITWSDEMFAAWMAERAKLTDLDTLEKHAREGHARLYEDIMNLTEAELDEPFEMPFPGEWKLADVLVYYHYNACYHDGQINYIGTLAKES